jgi:hypothetical protein
MKAGILTFHCAHNYGAVLQAYALQEYLKSLGHETEIIDYKPSYLTKIYDLFSLSRFKSMSIFNKIRYIITEPLALRGKRIRYNKFTSFINNKLQLSRPISNKESQLFEDYDVIFFGSDQIWNPKLTNGFDPIYFGEFKSRAKKIPYAPSMEATSLTNEQKEKYSYFLDNFSSISVRELRLKKLLQPLINKNISVVADPTFLPSKQTWDKITANPNIKEPYVLLYRTRSNKKVIEIAKKIAKEKKCKLIQISAIYYWYYVHNLKQNVSPEEFIGYIKNAEYVITTSFHGTAFSLILQKDFYTIKLGDGRDSRSENLLNEVKLGSRLISEYAHPKAINYNTNQLHIQKMADYSRNYIKDALC